MAQVENLFSFFGSNLPFNLAVSKEVIATMPEEIASDEYSGSSYGQRAVG